LVEQQPEGKVVPAQHVFDLGLLLQAILQAGLAGLDLALDLFKQAVADQVFNLGAQQPAAFVHVLVAHADYFLLHQLFFFAAFQTLFQVLLETLDLG